MDTIIKLIFEKIPALRLLDGYKRKIGNWLLVIAATLVAAQQAFAQNMPDLNVAWLTEVIAYLGAILRLFGDMHAQAK